MLRRLFALLLMIFALGWLVVQPEIDLLIAGWFFDDAARIFPLRITPWAQAIHTAVNIAARALGILLLVGLMASLLGWRWRVPRDWLFLLIGLLLAPGLVANTLLKDQFDRARPIQVQEFGGSASFSPPLLPADQCETNCSFVSGDASLGFFLHIFAYLAGAGLLARLLFWGGILAGTGLGLLRIGMGAHFFSDVIFACFFMLVTVALLHAVLYGPRATVRCWQRWLPWLWSRRERAHSAPGQS